MQANFINLSLLRKFFINLFILVIITTIFSNTIHRVHPSDSFQNVKYSNIEGTNYKMNISKYLASKDIYENYIDRECEITGSMEDRKKVRWVFKVSMYKVYNFLIDVDILLPYYFQIIFFSTLIFFSYVIIFKTFPINNEYKYLFLFFIAFVLQSPGGEFVFSIFEMFFLSLGLFASKSKNFLLFFITVFLATLNRESGILISLTWFIFNTDFKRFIYITGLTTLSFLLINYDIFSCLINLKFFVPLEYQHGQANFSALGKNINPLSSIKLILTNFIIPFSFCFYIYFITENKNKIILYILLIYLLIFLFALPANHMSSRLLLLPFLIGLIYFKSKNSTRTENIN